MSLNETCSEDRTVRCMCDVYRSKYSLKQKDVSALFRFQCDIVYAIRENPADYKGLKLIATLENLLCANDANLLAENKHTVCEGNERRAVLVTSNEVSLLANAEVKLGKFHNTRVGIQVF